MDLVQPAKRTPGGVSHGSPRSITLDEEGGELKTALRRKMSHFDISFSSSSQKVAGMGKSPSLQGIMGATWNPTGHLSSFCFTHEPQAF